MPKRWLIPGIASLGILAALVYALLSLPSESPPEAQALSRAVLSGDEREMAKVLKLMGTNSIPYLLQWIQDETQPVRLINPFSPTGRSKNRIYHRAEYAVQAFKILGPQAECAIPRLGQLANGDRPADFAGGRAALALSNIGEKAVPTLVAVLTNSTSAHRPIAALGLGYMGSSAIPALPALIACLHSGNPHLDAWSADALGRLGFDSEHVVPALVLALTNAETYPRAHAADALATYGQKAKAAIPSLLTATTDHDQDVRIAATNALLKIAPESLINPDALHSAITNALPR